jgi:hypothetical protein
MSQKIKQVKIGATSINVEVADTESSRELGLSNRDSLGEGSGMLFVFDQPQNVGFWMKDMRFDIDILFADAKRKIVTIYSNVPAGSYLKNPPEVFRPSRPAQYVLEVPAGFAERHGIVEGARFVLQ